MSEPGTEDAPEPDAEPDEHPSEPDEQPEEGDPLNEQITAALAESNAIAAGGPAQAAASLEQLVIHAAGLALLNAVNAQQNAYITANATVAAVVARILGTEPAPPRPEPTKAGHD
jgi:hypothetical protein